MAKRNFSSKRNAIYNTICSTLTHPSAKWVYEKLKPEIPDLSLGTVYRNIALFKNEGKVNVICSINGEERIDADTKPHPHFACNVCGKISDVKDSNTAYSENRELENAGYTVESRYVIYYGLCPECSKKRADGTL
ncbi:MAG: transcriptional repressor [Ruminococcus sp.]|nr:transcriptional repressor [Ruminococcus sp.]